MPAEPGLYVNFGQPVTQNNYDYDENLTLMSMTDVQSNILYANQAFINTSGIEHDELVGRPHNVVRHPNMPSAAFADLRTTVQNGEM